MVIGKCTRTGVAKVTKVKFFRTATKKLVASWRRVSIYVLDRKSEGNRNFSAFQKEN